MKKVFTMIKNLLKTLYQQQGFISFQPANKSDIEKTNAFLTNNYFAKLPQDYINFLTACNGFIFDGLELYGTKNHNRTTKKYTSESLISINEYFIDYEFFKHKTIIGKSAENFIFYNQKDNIYLITDQINLCTYVEFLKFEDILSEFIHLFELDS